MLCKLKKEMVGGRVVVTVASEGESISFQWVDAWAQWDDFQKSDELKGLVTKSNAILQKQGKGGVGRAKLQDALRLARDSSVRVRFHPGRSREEDVALPVLIFFDVVSPTVHVNSMGELGSDSTGVQCLDNTVLTSPFVDITIGQYCLGFLGQGRPSVS